MRCRCRWYLFMWGSFSTKGAASLGPYRGRVNFALLFHLFCKGVGFYLKKNPHPDFTRMLKATGKSMFYCFTPRTNFILHMNRQSFFTFLSMLQFSMVFYSFYLLCSFRFSLLYYKKGALPDFPRTFIIIGVLLSYLSHWFRLKHQASKFFHSFYLLLILLFSSFY